MSLPTRTTRDQFRPYPTVQKEFDTMLTRLFNAPVTHAAPTAGGRLADYFAPYGVDVREDADHLYVEAELPGFKKDEVEVTLEDQTLTLTAERKPDAPEVAAAKGEWLLHERRQTRVHRSFKLPQTVNDQQVAATLEHGVLTVTLNKREESKPRKITVQ